MHVQAGEIRYRIGEPGLEAHRVHQQVYAVGLHGVQVLLPVGGRHVNEPGSFVGRDDSAGNHPECPPAPPVLEVVEGRPVPDAEQVPARCHGHGIARFAEDLLDP